MARLPKPMKFENFNPKAGLMLMEVEVSIINTMSLQMFVPVSEVISDKGISRYFEAELRPQRVIDSIYIRDCGLVMHDYDNLHRTFVYNEKNYKILKGMVEKQDLEAYKKLIGVGEKKKEEEKKKNTFWSDLSLFLNKGKKFPRERKSAGFNKSR